jgi:hypothetical protein
MPKRIPASRQNASWSSTAKRCGPSRDVFAIGRDFEETHFQGVEQSIFARIRCFLRESKIIVAF